ncbi:hypothetical protein [Sutcliffiella halmapala]|uniref:hypothetical protein n=1 Tax=Sutcliffiella halmapala TaxID=79882 RepID=UPI0009955366|nr:hypothetical protein [Sutcliffiella halmapala]
MGYVLPIQMDAYTQYANRTAVSKEYIKLNPINRPSFYRIDSQNSWSEIQKNNPSIIVKKQNEEKRGTIPAHLLADITGKGRFVNELV